VLAGEDCDGKERKAKTTRTKQTNDRFDLSLQK
jgi:hypothetical protein